MAQNFDTKPYWKKVAHKEAFTEAELVALLTAVEAYQAATAYLADCNAATLNSLPKSTSKSAKARFSQICTISASLLDGNTQVIPHRASPDAAQAHCFRAIKNTQAGTSS